MICRLCLYDVIDVISIFDENGLKLNICEVLTKHFWFEPKVDDHISTVLCKSCWNTVEFFHKFYLGIEKAHILLNEKFSVRDNEEAVKTFPSPTNDNSIENDLNEIDILYENTPGIKSEEFLKDDDDDDDSNVENDEEEDEDFNDETQTTCTQSNNEDDNEEPVETLNVRVTRSKTNKITSVSYRTKRLTKNSRPTKKSEKVQVNKENDEKKSTKYRILSKEYDEKIAKHMKLRCEICQIEVATFADIKLHFRAVHSQKGYVVCCNKKILKRVLLVDHINKHLDPNYFKCHDCNKSFADKQCLKNHMLILHQAEEEKLYQCPDCSKRFAKKYLLDQHKAVHTPVGERNYFCDCGKAFPSPSLLNTHKKYVHSSAYSKMCDICAKVIRGKTAFEKHQQEHDGIKQPEVQCEKCGAWLKNKYSLQKHIRRHNDEGIVHSCNICGKIAPNQSALRSHFRYVHAAQRTYKCSVCDKAFKKPIILKEHMTTHTGEVLYSCPHCPKTFNSNANMHSHRKKVHRKEWEENRKFQKGKVASEKLPENEEVDSISNVNNTFDAHFLE